MNLETCLCGAAVATHPPRCVNCGHALCPSCAAKMVAGRGPECQRPTQPADLISH